MYTVKIATIDEFRSSRDVWNNLTSAMSFPSIFCTWEWIYTWWEHFGVDYNLLILFVYRDTELKGILPLASHKALLNNGWLTGRILTYCGSRELYPDHLDIISSKEHAEHCIQAVFEFLSATYKKWDVCDLRLMVEDGSLASWINTTHKNMPSSLDVAIKQASVACFIHISGSFEHFINSLDTKQKYNLRTRKRKLDELGFTYTPCNPSINPEALDILFRIHALRSKKKKIRSTFSSAAILNFHKSLVQRIHKKGWVALRVLKNDKDTIAASYNFVFNGRVFSYQKGMDPQWERYGPGRTIVYEAIHEAFAGGSTEYNFLQGDEAYKNQWARQYRVLVTSSIFNKTAAGIISKVLMQCRKTVSNLLKKFS